MHLIVPNQKGYLADQYGQHNPLPTPLSFPFDITEFPEDTASFALTFVDFDAIPVGGFPWIHWIAANIDVANYRLPENASHGKTFDFVQGRNSLAGAYVGEQDPAINTGYANPAPPDKDHRYTLSVYALDTKLKLTTGFWMNELYDAMDGHIIDQDQLDLSYRSMK
ncbi:YbhB/YbcL family Raf kinase inhibitor-like protein [Agrilactobacillus yilanensis]|uniref:YbhB/YbcL family Raf kinase inhibitor-like protein n=1 Tax=Agrilactobacillus yilanensis TaxID=2485997 RepID=A0ABW4J2D5_9LACO|nr:YbhB/YbcL family Raf kinase inhibitor-like protein [Agrilactobacillus yilanensis]